MPDDAEDLTRVEIDRHVFDGVYPTERLGDVAHFNEWRMIHGAPQSSWYITLSIVSETVGDG